MPPYLELPHLGKGRFHKSIPAATSAWTQRGWEKWDGFGPAISVAVSGPGEVSTGFADDNWTDFAALVVQGATPYRARYLAVRRSGVRVPPGPHSRVGNCVAKVADHLLGVHKALRLARNVYVRTDIPISLHWCITTTCLSQLGTTRETHS
jgi:hypothetical protein